MRTTRIMPFADLTGRTVNTLQVGEMVSRSSQFSSKPRYRTICETCGAQSTEGHDRLITGAARCVSTTHDRPSKRHDAFAEERSAATQREIARLAEEREVSARRMEAEAEDWERPTRYTPSPEAYQPMSERERLALRERRDTEETAEQERLRPIREAEEFAAEEHRERETAEQARKDKQTAYWREWVLNSPDPQLFVTPEIASASMKQLDADKFNAQEVQKFVAETPEYAEFRTPSNSEVLLSYLSRNGVRIFDAATMKATFIRLRELGILIKKAPAPVPHLPQPRRANLPTAEPSKPANPLDETVDGWELDGSAPRKWTQRELTRLSSTDYRRALRIYKDALTLTQLSPLARA